MSKSANQADVHTFRTKSAIIHHGSKCFLSCPNGFNRFFLPPLGLISIVRLHELWKISNRLLTSASNCNIIAMLRMTDRNTIEDGELAEWSKAHDWKSCVGLYPT